MTLVGMAGRRNAIHDLEAMRTAIGAALRTLYPHLLRESVPDRMAELLRQLDQPTKSGQDTDNA
jgi:hypothetical protein